MKNNTFSARIQREWSIEITRQTFLNDKSGSHKENLTWEICKRKTLEINRFGAFKLLEREKTNERTTGMRDHVTII